MSVTEPAPPPRPADECLRCGTKVSSMGVEEFRVGGTSGGWKFFFGELAELGEQMIPIEMIGCSACGHIELRRPGFGPPPSPDDDWGRAWQAHDRQS